MGRSSQSRHSTNTVIRGRLHKAMLEYRYCVQLTARLLPYCARPITKWEVARRARDIQHRPGLAVHQLAPLKAAGVAISIDGKGRWINNVFIERLWRSVKYEEVYLRAYANGHEAQHSLSKYFLLYNAVRTHQSLEYRTPDEVYFGEPAASTPIAA